MGTCDPMRMDASFPSDARTLGFWINLVLELLARYWTSVGGIVTEKLAVPMWAKRLRVIVLVAVVVVPDVTVWPLNVIGIGVSCDPTGGNIPRSRRVLRSTSITVASTKISGFALSRSSIIFSAIAMRSAVSRTIIAFIDVL